jgi:hypothetical protein
MLPPHDLYLGLAVLQPYLWFPKPAPSQVIQSHPLRHAALLAKLLALLQ